MERRPMKARKRAVEEKKCHMSWLSKNSPQLHGSFRFLTERGKDCVKYADNTGFGENSTVCCFVKAIQIGLHICVLVDTVQGMEKVHFQAKTRAAGALWPSPRLWWRAVPGLVALGIEAGRCYSTGNGQTEEGEADQHPHLSVYAAITTGLQHILCRQWWLGSVFVFYGSGTSPKSEYGSGPVFRIQVRIQKGH